MTRIRISQSPVRFNRSYGIMGDTGYIEAHEKRFTMKGGDNNMKEQNGYEKAKEVAEQLKAEKTQKESKDIAAHEIVKNDLALVEANAELAKLYNDNAQVGSQNLSSASPYLKIHAAGKSVNVLADGSKPNDGWFFYAPTQEQFKTVQCHILTISKGFKAEDLNKEMKFTQVLGGLMINGGMERPFVMFLSGTKLSPMWEFGKEASRWTKAKPISIPMFAMTVQLSTKEVKTEYGYSWIPVFEIVKSESGLPNLVLDAGKFSFLKDSVTTIEEIIDALIANKENKKEEHVQEIHAEEETVDQNDMPFS